MRRIKVLGLGIGSTLGALLLAVPVPVYAKDLSPSQLEKIKTNCVSIKSSITQLHVSDALLRVNRGQLYESMGTNLMDPFNNRLGNGKLDNKAMVAVTDQYRSALDTFRSDYIAYEQKLSAVLRTDCVSRPQTFYTMVLEARELRGAVHNDIGRLHLAIDDYRSSVGSFLLNFERVSE